MNSVSFAGQPDPARATAGQAWLHCDAAADVELAKQHEHAQEQVLLGLMPLICNGCRASFERLYQLTASRLFGIVLRINPTRPEAEEVLQEIYVKVWTRRSSFDGAKGPVMFWLAAIARYGAIDSLRRRQARPEVNLNSDVSAADDCYAGFASATPGPLESVIQNQGAHAIRDMLRALPDTQRQSLTLAFYDGLSCSQIAQHLNQPLGTVKSALRRAFQKMRPALADHR